VAEKKFEAVDIETRGTQRQRALMSTGSDRVARAREAEGAERREREERARARERERESEEAEKERALGPDGAWRLVGEQQYHHDSSKNSLAYWMDACSTPGIYPGKYDSFPSFGFFFFFFFNSISVIAFLGGTFFFCFVSSYYSTRIYKKKKHTQKSRIPFEAGLQ
jgi:hypothetical protein